MPLERPRCEPCQPRAFPWAGRTEPDYFTKCSMFRQMRDGRDPLTDVRMSLVEFTNALTCGAARRGAEAADREWSQRAQLVQSLLA